MPVQAIEQSVTVHLPAVEAFRIFVYDLGEWWPAAYTWSQDRLQGLLMEPRVGGFCTELGPDGFRIDWGQVKAFSPPHDLEFSWQISARREPVPDPQQASRVRVRFLAEAKRETEVQVTHKQWERHGDGAAEYAQAMGSEYGWPYILQQYAERCALLSGN